MHALLPIKQLLAGHLPSVSLLCGKNTSLSGRDATLGRVAVVTEQIAGDDGCIEPAISASDVRDQMERILASPAFARSERLSRFLRFAVGTALDGNPEVLKETVLAIEVFDRDSSYDPRIDSVVRVQAGRLRARIEDYYKGPGAGDPISITFIKGGYVPRFETRSSAQTAPVPDAVTQGPKSPGAGTLPSPTWKRLVYALLWTLSVVLLNAILAGRLRPAELQHPPLISHDAIPQGMQLLRNALSRRPMRGSGYRGPREFAGGDRDAPDTRLRRSGTRNQTRSDQ